MPPWRREEMDTITQCEVAAEALIESSKAEEAAELFDRALCLRIRLLGPRHESLSSTAVRLGSISNQAANTELRHPAPDLDRIGCRLKRNLALLAEVGVGANAEANDGLPPASVASLVACINQTLRNLAALQLRRGSGGAALVCLKQAFSLCPGIPTADSAATHLSLCAVLSQLGKHDEAERHAAEAVRLGEQDILDLSCNTGSGNRHCDAASIAASVRDKASSLAVSYNNLAIQRELLGKTRECIAIYEKAVVLAEGHMDADCQLLARLRESHQNAVRAATQRDARPQPPAQDRPSSSNAVNTRQLKMAKPPRSCVLSREIAGLLRSGSDSDPAPSQGTTTECYSGDSDAGGLDGTGARPSRSVSCGPTLPRHMRSALTQIATWSSVPARQPLMQTIHKLGWQDPTDGLDSVSQLRNVQALPRSPLPVDELVARSVPRQGDAPMTGAPGHRGGAVGARRWRNASSKRSRSEQREDVSRNTQAPRSWSCGGDSREIEGRGTGGNPEIDIQASAACHSARSSKIVEGVAKPVRRTLADPPAGPLELRLPGFVAESGGQSSLSLAGPLPPLGGPFSGRDASRLASRTPILQPIERLYGDVASDCSRAVGTTLPGDPCQPGLAAAPTPCRSGQESQEETARDCGDNRRNGQDAKCTGEKLAKDIPRTQADAVSQIQRSWKRWNRKRTALRAQLLQRLVRTRLEQKSFQKCTTAARVLQRAVRKLISVKSGFRQTIRCLTEKSCAKRVQRTWRRIRIFRDSRRAASRKIQNSFRRFSARRRHKREKAAVEIQRRFRGAGLRLRLEREGSLLATSWRNEPEPCFEDAGVGPVGMGWKITAYRRMHRCKSRKLQLGNYEIVATSRSKAQNAAYRALRSHQTALEISAESAFIGATTKITTSVDRRQTPTNVAASLLQALEIHFAAGSLSLRLGGPWALKEHARPESHAHAAAEQAHAEKATIPKAVIPLSSVDASPVVQNVDKKDHGMPALSAQPKACTGPECGKEDPWHTLSKKSHSLPVPDKAMPSSPSPTSFGPAISPTTIPRMTSRSTSNISVDSVTSYISVDFAGVATSHADFAASIPLCSAWQCLACNFCNEVSPDACVLCDSLRTIPQASTTATTQFPMTSR